MNIMKQEKLKRRAVYIGDKLWLALKKVAKREDLTMSFLIREAIKSKEGI